MKNCGQTFDKALEAVHAFQEALQGTLFPDIEAEIGGLDERHRKFVGICAAVRATRLISLSTRVTCDFTSSPPTGLHIGPLREGAVGKADWGSTAWTANQRLCVEFPPLFH